MVPFNINYVPLTGLPIGNTMQMQWDILDVASLNVRCLMCCVYNAVFIPEKKLWQPSLELGNI